MDFRIADTFTDSLARLTGDEQKAVKTTAFDLQMNPASPGVCLSRLTRCRNWNVLLMRRDHHGPSLEFTPIGGIVSRAWSILMISALSNP